MLTVPFAASAAPVTVSAGISIEALDGKHDTGSSVDRLSFVPLPLGEFDARLGRWALHLEGLPPLTFCYGGPGERQRTQLSIFNATYRAALRGGVFAGVGQTVYNQRTSYAANALNGVAQQASRVTGLRLEAGLTRRVFGATDLEYTFAFNPSMRGVERTVTQTPALPEIANPERAVQIDTTIFLVTPLHRGRLIYGLRYLNYASRYDARGLPYDALLADRNVGFLPSVGYRIGL